MPNRYGWMLFAGLTLAGCQDTTSPTVDGRPLSLQDADRQYKARLLVLDDGKTTRADILSVMGDPDRTSDDGKILMYYWTVNDKDADKLRRSFVIAEFKGDTLARHSVFSDSARFGGPKLPDDALAEFIAGPKP